MRDWGLQTPIDALAIGETMVLVAPRVPAALASGCDVELRTGGAESNVAIHLARMGHRSAWAGAVGGDPLGRLILDELVATGVDTSHAITDPIARTGVYFKHMEAGRTRVQYYRDDSAASRLTPAFVDGLVDLRPRILHLSGATAALSSSCRELAETLVRERPIAAGIVSFDVNYRPGLWNPSDAAPILHAVASAADVVFVGLDEAREIWGTDDADAVRAELPAPPVLVVKDSGEGAFEYNRDQRVYAPAPPVEIVEAVGAGDAFAAGWLSGRLRGYDAAARLRLGHRIAGLVLRSTSDDVEIPADLRADLVDGRAR